jgi:hypothetical protein
MGGKTTEVKARVVVEDGGSSVLDKIRRAFLGSSEAAEEAESHAESFAQQIAATAIGTNLMPAVMRVKDLATGFVHAGVEAQNADQAVAGLIASVQGIPWEESYEKAAGLGDELDEIALKMNAAGDQVGDAFNTLVELGEATDEGLRRAKEQTESIALLSTVLGKNAGNIAREFGFMQEGALKTKGQLFQLLQPTGIFGKETKKAAEYWSKMTEESRAQQLAYGLEKVAARLNESTPTIGNYLTTLDNLKNLAAEKFGEPLARSLDPTLKKVIDKVSASIPAIEKLGQTLAKDVAEWVDEAVKEIEEGFKYLADHEKEIRDAIKEGYREAKEVVQFILAHKEEIAIAFGASKVAPAVGAAGRLAGGIAQTASAGIPSLGLAGTGGSGLLAGAGAVTAFAAAVGAWTIAIDQWKSYMDETEGGKSEAEQDQAARQRYFAQMAASPSVGAMNVAGFDEIRKAYVETATELGENSRAAGELADQAWASYRAVREMTQPAEEAAKLMDHFAKSLQAGMIPDEQDLARQQSLIDSVATGFDAARTKQNAAAMQYIADVLLKSEGLRNAFITSANLTGDAFDVLADLVKGKNEDFAAALRARAGEGRAGAAVQAAPKVVMNGGQTFNIKQDFRDQDPDRVAIVFERDVARMSERRLQAGTSSPFGV